MARRLKAGPRPAAWARLGLAVPLVAGTMLLSGCATALDHGDVTSSLQPLGAAPGQNEADKAREHWAAAYAKDPHDEKAVIAFARALKADGAKDRAFSVLQQAAIYNPDSKAIASEEGRLALDLGQTDLAEKLLARANDPAAPDWRTLNALGALQAKRGDHAGAQRYFERAAELSPDNPTVINNLALCHALAGDSAKAEQLLRQAMADGGNKARIRQNLALVLGVQGKYDDAEKIAAADIGKEQAQANRAYLQKMVDATPVGRAKPGKVAATAASAIPQTITDGWRTTVKVAAAPKSRKGKPGHPGLPGWSSEVAAVPEPAPRLPWQAQIAKVAAK